MRFHFDRVACFVQRDVMASGCLLEVDEHKYTFRRETATLYCLTRTGHGLPLPNRENSDILHSDTAFVPFEPLFLLFIKVSRELDGSLDVAVKGDQEALKNCTCLDDQLYLFGGPLQQCRGGDWL